jgi:hypothetical protein
LESLFWWSERVNSCMSNSAELIVDLSVMVFWQLANIAPLPKLHAHWYQKLSGAQGDNPRLCDGNDA